MNSTEKPTFRLARRYALLGIYAMAALQVIWYLWLAPTVTLPKAVGLSLALAPIMPAVILGVLGRPSATFWAGVASLLYFCHGITELWTTPDVWPLALLELGLSLWIIFSANWHGLQAKLLKRKSP